MSFLHELRQAARHQRVLMKHRPDRRIVRLALMGCWLLFFTTVFATIEGIKQGNLGTWVWWSGLVPGHLLVSLCITISFFSLFRLFERLAPQRWLDTITGWHDWRVGAFYSVFSAVCALIGLLIGLLMVDLVWVQHGLNELIVTRDFWAQFVLLTLGISAVSGLIYRARWKREALQARATEAQLRLLQGQIEPHFLFNTLANVQSLIDFDPERAKRLLEGFTDYLRASMQQLRRDESSVAQEFATLEAYLGLMRIRMGDRLRFHLDASAESAAALLPPLLVQPLVENAIHHGLDPKVEGGELSVRAMVADGELRIDVEDDGQGLDGPRRPGRSGNGVAVANIRERLAGRWGPRATLELTPRDGGGTRATLRLPLTQAKP